MEVSAGEAWIPVPIAGLYYKHLVVGIAAQFQNGACNLPSTYNKWTLRTNIFFYYLPQARGASGKYIMLEDVILWVHPDLFYMQNQFSKIEQKHTNDVIRTRSTFPGVLGGNSFIRQYKFLTNLINIPVSIRGLSLFMKNTFLTCVHQIASAL